MGGFERLSGSDKADPQQAKARHAPKKSADLSHALRSAYDDALREDIPADFRELLNKLR